MKQIISILCLLGLFCINVSYGYSAVGIDGQAHIIPLGGSFTVIENLDPNQYMEPFYCYLDTGAPQGSYTMSYRLRGHNMGWGEKDVPFRSEVAKVRFRDMYIEQIPFARKVTFYQIHSLFTVRCFYGTGNNIHNSEN